MLSYLIYKYVFSRPEHNAKGGGHGTEFWRSWNAKMKYFTDRGQRVDEKRSEISKWGHLSIYHVYPQSSLKYKKWLIFVFSAGVNEILVTVWAPERS